MTNMENLIAYKTRPSIRGTIVEMDTKDRTFGNLLLDMGIRPVISDAGKMEFLCHPANIMNLIRKIRTETGRQLIANWEM